MAARAWGIDTCSGGAPLYDVFSHGGKPARPRFYARSSIRWDAGIPDHPGPERNIRLDDRGELLERRAFHAAACEIELFADLGRSKSHLQRLADLADNRLRCL